MITKMEQEYFEKMIESEFRHVKSDYQEIKKTLDKILEQTTKTNGRLRELETWRASSQGHCRGVVLVCTVLGFVIGIISVYLWH